MNKKILFAILLVIALGIFISAKSNKDNVSTDAGTVCTMDALLCPDGTSLGRSGPMCQFGTCTGTEFKGTISQGDNGFIMNANGVLFPVEMKVTNALPDILNKEVIVSGKFISENKFEINSLIKLLEEDQAVSNISIGQTKNINGVSVTLHEVVQDSRCPVDVNCIEAGAITAKVTFKSGAQTKTFNMASDEIPQQFGGKKVSIIDVNPPLVSSIQPNKNNYIVTFEVK